jgi:hypothetical protein
MFFDFGGESGEGSDGLVFGRGDGCGEVSSNTATRQIGADGVEGFGGGLHDIVSGTAVNVDVDVGGDESGFGKAMSCGDALMIAGREAFYADDAMVLDGDEWMLDSSAWTYESSRRYGTDHRYLSSFAQWSQSLVNHVGNMVWPKAGGVFAGVPILINLQSRPRGISCLQISSSSIVVHTGSKEEEFHCRFTGFLSCSGISLPKLVWDLVNCLRGWFSFAGEFSVCCTSGGVERWVNGRST